MPKNSSCVHVDVIEALPSKLTARTAALTPRQNSVPRANLQKKFSPINATIQQSNLHSK